MPYVDQRNLYDSRTPLHSVTDLSIHDYPFRNTTPVAMTPFTKSFSPAQDYEYMYSGDIAQQSRNFSIVEFKGENMCQIMPDQSLLPIEYYEDQEATLRGPFV